MKGQSYNEKVDVFSFAVIIFELLSGRVAMAAIGDQRDLDYEAVHAHAEETANGFRLPLPVNWPAAVLSLINDCWAQRSSKRPSFATIERRLQEIKVTCSWSDGVSALQSSSDAVVCTSVVDWDAKASRRCVVCCLCYSSAGTVWCLHAIFQDLICPIGKLGHAQTARVSLLAKCKVRSGRCLHAGIRDH